MTRRERRWPGRRPCVSPVVPAPRRGDQGSASRSAAATSDGSNGFAMNDATPCARQSVLHRLLGERAEHHDGDVARLLVGTEDVQDRVPVHHRHHQIEHDRVRPLTPRDADPAEAVVGKDHFEAGCFEGRTQDVADPRFVVDHEYARHERPPFRSCIGSFGRDLDAAASRPRPAPLVSWRLRRSSSVAEQPPRKW